MADDTPISRVRLHFRQLQNDRRTQESYWNDVRTYITPQRGRGIFTYNAEESNNGERDSGKRINGAASRALTTLASGMQSGLTSKARQWFLLSHPDPDLGKYQPVREWYDTVQEVLERLFRKSNLYSALLHTYFEMGGFGQGAIGIFSHPDKTLFCRPYTTGTYYMSNDEYNEIDTFFQVSWMTVRQLVQRFGKENLPDYIREDYDTGRYETRFEVVNAMLRHPEMYGIKIGEQYNVASATFLASAKDSDKFLKVSGYRSFPVMTPRWDAIDNDVYGWAPTRDIIGDVKMLQRMESDALKGVAKAVSPPMRVPPELERRGLDVRPNAINVVSSMGEHAVAPLYTAQTNIQQLQYKIDAVTAAIKDGLYNSLFLALLTQDNPQMTAREVAERHEEKLLMLGPVLERIHYELLDPLIDRAFLLAYEDGLIPPPPPELEGQPTQIEYVSILSQAQKAVGVNRIEQSVQFLGGMTAVYPELRHALDPFKTYQAYNGMIGVKAGIFRSEKEYQEAVAAEQRKQELAQGAEVGQNLASSAKLLSEVDRANVTDLLGGGSGGGLIL